MLSIIADMILTATRQNGPHQNDRQGYPDHLKEHPDSRMPPQSNHPGRQPRYVFDPNRHLW